MVKDEPNLPMIQQKLVLKAQKLQLPFKTAFRHASADRKVGQSVWVCATLDTQVGFGEGCPRIYVTGEDLETCFQWTSATCKKIASTSHLPALLDWKQKNASEIDRHPSGWCAIESALLDVLAQKKGLSVEGLLGLDTSPASFQYTAVVGNDPDEKYVRTLNKYFDFGFTDFKIKLSGDLAGDRWKLDKLQKTSSERGIPAIRVRLDANNYWKDDTDAAINHLKALGDSFFAIEEPVSPKNFEALSAISVSLNKAIILDESLCTMADLKALDNLPGQYIANIKVSRVGGVLRALDLVDALKAREWPIIVGAHVGETSVLTRAGICVARAAGASCIAQEGAFGTLLLEKDAVAPSLRFGEGGVLYLDVGQLTGWGVGSAEY